MRVLAPLARALACLSIVFSASAWAQTDTDSEPGDAATDSAFAAGTALVDSSGLPPRTFISTDGGGIRVFEERRPGEGIDGFWWEYDPAVDLERLLDEDRRSRLLDKLTDAFGFEIFAPESIVALRDSVTTVADSILATRIDLAKVFDPKLTSRYSENRDTFEFVNELVSPIPLTRQATLQTTLTNNDSFNESTRKVQDRRSLASTLTYAFRPKVTTSLSFNRNEDEQRREEEVESRTTGTNVSGRIQAVRSAGPLGDMTAELGLAGSQNNYRTVTTNGSSELISPTWTARLVRPSPAGNLSADYTGNVDRGTRNESQTVPVLDENGFPVLGPSGQPLTERRESETEDSNDRNKLDLSADGKLSPTWNYRLNSSLSRDRTQFIAQADSLAGQQETRTNTVRTFAAHVDAKPWPGLDLRVDGNIGRNEFDYELERIKFNDTRTWGGDAEVGWETWKDSKLTIRLGRDREDRNYLTSQAGVVDKESAGVNWKQTITPKVDFTANYDVSLDSFLFDDKVENTGDRDLRNQRGVFTVRYNVSSAFTSSLRMDIRKNETVNISAQRSRDNKTDYAYVITPNYTLRIGAASLSGEFNADARYAVYDADDELNSLTRRFSTRQRWQQALSENVSIEALGTYEIVDDGGYARRVEGGDRLYQKARETRRFRAESTVLYNPRGWLRTKVTYRQDGDDTYSFESGERAKSGVFRTEEFTFGITVKKKFLRHIDLDLDFNHSQKDGDRVTDVERRSYTIRAALDYRPFGERKSREEP
jgi:hypothetical protein